MTGHELKSVDSYYLFRWRCECGAVGLTERSAARATEGHARHVRAVEAAAAAAEAVREEATS